MSHEGPKLAVSPREIGVFVAYAAIIAVIAVGMYAVAPRGLGQVLGVAFALILLPVPLVVVYFTRWRKRAK